MLGFYILILSGGTAQAEGNHFLSFGLAGGGSIAPRSELGSSPAVGDADFDGGYSIKASLGFLLAKQLQLEGEYLFTHNRYWFARQSSDRDEPGGLRPGDAQPDVECNLSN